MSLVRTEDLKPNELRTDNLQVYCGLDTMLTLEIFEELCSLPTWNSDTYRYERALQGPLLEIMLRGFRVDEIERQHGIETTKEKLNKLDSMLQRFAFAVWAKPLNPRSQAQLRNFFYDTMRIPEQWVSEKGVKKLSFKREVLEKLEIYFYSRPIVATILAIRDLTKQLETLETEVDSDGRMRTSYNIAGTETWRLSSSSNAFGTGGNLQNIAPSLRKMFIADNGKKLCVIDLEQAESREVGWLLGTLFDDWTYLNACEGGDLHTYTARLIWPKLAWAGDRAGDRAIADRKFYRDFSYRDMSKRGGHGTTYFGTPWTMARHLKVPLVLMQEFQKAFFAAFPFIPRWHRWVAEQLQTIQKITTPFGQTRQFFGRPNDEATLREAIAFGSQSSTAIRTNLGLLRHWQYFGKRTQLLAQTHDSITFQYDEQDETEIIPQALQLMLIWFEHKGRKFTIPGEAKVGWNWQAASPTNPNGLLKFKGHDLRQRTCGLSRVLP